MKDFYSFVRVSAAILILLAVNCCLSAQSIKSIYDTSNLVAWCIVPFDNPERTPEQRCAMLKELGIGKLAYDWRERHVPKFESEIAALKKNNIRLQSFWYYSGAEPEKDKNLAIIFNLLRKHKIKTEIWTMITGVELDSLTQQQKVEAVGKRVQYIAAQAGKIGCKVGLYNHGEWFGEPENQLAIIDHLKMPNLGIVYNFSHAEHQIHRFPEFYPKIKPYLLAINITGLEGTRPAQVVPVGQGNVEFEMMKIIEESGYQGPIGIINEDFAQDAKIGLQMNLKGIEKYKAGLSN